MSAVVGAERAVALKHPLAFVGPVAFATAGIAVLAGHATLAAWLVASASFALVAISVVVVMRQRADRIVLLLVAALAWATGSVVHALGAWPVAVVAWWLAFLVLTIAAERLEMTRLLRRWRRAPSLLYAVCAVMPQGAALSAANDELGGVLYGLTLAALAVWLFSFDVARRTVHARGLSRYMAVCLLLGYAWLLVGGIAWTATALGLPFRGAALHRLALGFVFSMVLAHAPAIVPAITRVKLLFGPAYYVPLGLLHGSLVVRLVAGHVDFRALAAGAAATPWRSAPWQRRSSARQSCGASAGLRRFDDHAPGSLLSIDQLAGTSIQATSIRR